MLLILGLIGRDRLLDDLPRDPFIVNIHKPARVTGQLRAINRHHPRFHEPRLAAQLEDRREQPGQRLLMAAHEPRDGRMIGNLIRGDHQIGDVLETVPLDPRDEYSFVQYAYVKRHTMTAGSYDARPCPSARYAA